MVGHINQRAECLNIQVSTIIFLSDTVINLKHFFDIDHSGIHLRVSVILYKDI